MTNREKLLNTNDYDLLCNMNKNLIENDSCIMEEFEAYSNYRCEKYLECDQCISDWMNEDDNKMLEIIDKNALIEVIDKEIDLFSATPGNHDYREKIRLELAKKRVEEQPIIKIFQQNDRCVPIRTNGDRIRQMTDEELAKFIVSHANYVSDVCKFYNVTKVCRIIAWLKQELSEDAAERTR